MKKIYLISLLFILNSLYAKPAVRSSRLYARQSPPNFASLRVPKTSAPTVVAQKIVEEETPAARLSVSPTFALQNGVLGYGAIADLSFSTGVPFYLGVSSGYLQFEGDDSSGAQIKTALVPVLINFSYRFNLQSGVVHPYLA